MNDYTMTGKISITFFTLVALVNAFFMIWFTLHSEPFLAGFSIAAITIDYLVIEIIKSSEQVLAHDPTHRP